MEQKKHISAQIDIRRGIVPISKAAGSLAMIVKQTREQRQPVILTQYGEVSAVILDIDSYAELKELADRQRAESSQS